MSGASGVGVKVQAESSAAGLVLQIINNALNQVYSISMPTGSGNVCRIRNETNNKTVMDIGTDGGVRLLAATFGAFSATPVTKPAVSGSRGSATAAVLQSLLTALSQLGWITDNTTP